jgi:hypothetical protein
VEKNKEFFADFKAVEKVAQYFTPKSQKLETLINRILLQSTYLVTSLKFCKDPLRTFSNFEATYTCGQNH